MYNNYVHMYLHFHLFVLGFVHWAMVRSCSTQAGGDSADFTELAHSLCLLLQYQSRSWSEEDIVSIIEELTSMLWLK